MVEVLLLFVLFGCLLGVVTGAIPGLHVNTVALLVLAGAAFGGMEAVLLIASMSIVHTFVDFVPSVVLGAPSTDTFLAVLPGHRLLLQGKGMLAVRLTVVGGLAAGTMALAAAPLFVMFLEKGAGFLSGAVPFALGAVLLLMLFGERGKRLEGAAVILLSGLLGIVVLRGGLPVGEPLFCLAAGFFGASTLVYALLKRPELCEQRAGGFFVKGWVVFRNSFLAVLGGALVALLPGIGASQAAFLIRKVVGRIRTADYLVLLGGVNTVNMLLSFFVLFAWGKTRTGSAAAIKQLAGVGMGELLFIAAACVIAMGFAVFATEAVARAVLRLVHRFPYRAINGSILLFVSGLVFAFSGIVGMAAYGTAAAFGLAALGTGSRRSNCMAFLMVPTILFYLGV